LWDNKWKLKKTEGFENVDVDEDLSPVSAKKRAKLRSSMRLAKETAAPGEKIFIRKQTLQIGSSKYTVDHLPMCLRQGGSV
jgi:hypothetical protein